MTMPNRTLEAMEPVIVEKVKELAAQAKDSAHDFLHFERVVKTAKNLCAEERARFEVVIPAAWLHDFVIVPKDDPRRKMASRLSAEKAVQFLKDLNYPSIYLEDIAHAIAAHSFSAAIEPTTLEAKIVQDADRLDGLGAIGIARCFAVAGQLNRSFYNSIDPWCASRDPDDTVFTVDHFYKKLFKISQTLQTPSAQKEGLRRVSVMRDFLKNLEAEI